MAIENKFLKGIQAHRGEPFGLATIVSHIGSTPRSVGTRMALTTTGSLVGTIGGGKLEAGVITALERVMRSGTATILEQSFSGEDAASMDMICGGAVRILLELVTPDRTDFWRVVDHLLAEQAIVVGVRLAGGTTNYFDEMTTEQHYIEFLAANRVGRFELPRLVLAKDGEYYIEPAGMQTNVHLFGAGHVSQALAAITGSVGFRTIIYDDRVEFANQERFLFADQVRVVQPVESVLEMDGLDQNDFIVIVTRGHMHDKSVLERALATRAGYIGMIGSRRKAKLIMDELTAKGFLAEQLARVHAPIGLDIKAETPEEIAVSILAELILERAKIASGS